MPKTIPAVSENIQTGIWANMLCKNGLKVRMKKIFARLNPPGQGMNTADSHLSWPKYQMQAMLPGI